MLGLVTLLEGAAVEWVAPQDVAWRAPPLKNLPPAATNRARGACR